LIDAAGTSVERIRPSGADLAQRVGVRTQLAARKYLKVETAIGVLFDCGRHLPRPNVHRMRFLKIICIFVDPLRLLRATDARGGSGAK